MSRIRLEPMGGQHLDVTLTWLRSPELRAAIDSRGSVPSTEEHIEYWTRRYASPDEETYAVIADGDHVGNCGLLLDRGHQRAELWLYLGDPATRGSGLGRGAAECLLRRVFAELRLDEAVVRVLTTNRVALSFWRSLGFTDMPRAPSADIRAGSEWLALMRDTWEETSCHAK